MFTLLLTLGCSGDVSNAIFLDDAAFLAALPGPEHFHVDYPGVQPYDAETCPDELAAFYCLTRGALESVDGILVPITSVASLLRSVPPTTREPDARTWGPDLWDGFSPAQLLVEMRRTPTGSAFATEYFGSQDLDDWTSMLQAIHRAGDEEVAAGDGELVWDTQAMETVVQAGYAGLIEVHYDVRDETWVSLHTEGAELAGGVWGDLDGIFQEGEDGSGDLQLGFWSVEEPGWGRVRWDPEGSGRADWTQLGSPAYAISQCWSADGTLTWEQIAPGEDGNPDTGEGCPFDDVAEANDLAP